MRRFWLAGIVPLFSLPLFAQIPAPQNAQNLKAMTPPHSAKPLESLPNAPRALPDTVEAALKLPQKENLAKIDPNSLSVRRTGEHWHVMQGLVFLRDFGPSQADAEEFVKTIREMRPMEWGSIGTNRTFVEYGLTCEGKAQKPSTTPKTAVNIDPKSVRLEKVRGVLVLRDDENILLNFGNSKEDGEQTLAVIRKYEFNRLAQVGPAVGGATILFAQEVAASAKPKAGYGDLQRAHQEMQLTRTGIEVPGNTSSAIVGERIEIDPKNVELKRNRGDWQLVSGNEVLASFGASEWSGRDALKLVQDQRFTEFCRFNSEITFFLVNGQAPTKVPFAVNAVRFDRENLKVKTSTAGKFGIHEGNGGRQLFAVETEKEGEQLIKLIQHYGFDTSCQMGLSAKASLKFLAKTGR